MLNIGVQAWGPPPPPLKNLQHPHAPKILHHKLFQETPQGFFLTENQNFFSASSRISIFPLIIICPLRHAKKMVTFLCENLST